MWWTAITLATLWPDLKAIDLSMTMYQPDKVVHLVAFGVLAYLLVYALATPGRLPQPRHVLLGVVLAAAYGVVNEWTQGWVPGRSFSVVDMAANMMGPLLVGYAMNPAAARRFWWRWRVVVYRVVLVGGVVAMGYAAFEPRYRWSSEFYWWPINLGWPRGRAFPLPQIAHAGAAMLLTWLAPAAQVLGRRRAGVKAVILVAIVAASALPIEYIQVKTGRSWQIGWVDVLFHEIGVVLGLVIWALAAAMYVPPRTRDHLEAPDDSTDPPAPTAFVGHALLVSILTLLSRFTGVVRDSVLGAVFGLSPVMGAFTVGFMIPNLFRRLFGEGALTAAFIPAYTEHLKKDPQLARKLASLCIGLLVIVTVGLTLIGIEALGLLHDIRPWSPSSRLAIQLSRTMLPFMPMVCVVALLGGILQVHGRFGPAAAAPIIVNLCMILAAALAGAGIRGSLSSVEAQRAIYLVAYSVLAAGAVQVIWQVVAVLRVESFTLRCAEAWDALKPVLWVMVPMMLGLAVFQINALMDTLLAFGLAQPEGRPPYFNLFGYQIAYPIEGKGDTAALAFAQRLYQFPLGVFGIAIATAIFPALSHAVTGRRDEEPDRGEFRTILQHGLRLTMFIGLPAGAGLILLRLPIARAIFEYRNFDLDASLRVASILAGYSAAIWAYSMTHVLTRAFYAVKNAKTPLRISMAMVALNLSLNLTLIWFLGAAGLAWSTSITAIMQTAVLLLAVRRYVERPIDAAVWRSWGKAALLTLVMAAVLWPLVAVFDPAALSRLHSLALLATGMALGLAIYLGGAWWMGLEELRWLLHRRAK